MGSFSIDDAAIAKHQRWSKIIGRAMEIDPSAFRTTEVDFAQYDPGIYNLRHKAIAQATKEIDDG